LFRPEKTELSKGKTSSLISTEERHVYHISSELLQKKQHSSFSALMLTVLNASTTIKPGITEKIHFFPLFLPEKAAV
jgi:hypothetical protein